MLHLGFFFQLLHPAGHLGATDIGNLGPITIPFTECPDELTQDGVSRRNAAWPL